MKEPWTEGRPLSPTSRRRGEVFPLSCCCSGWSFFFGAVSRARPAEEARFLGLGRIGWSVVASAFCFSRGRWSRGSFFRSFRTISSISAPSR